MISINQMEKQLTTHPSSFDLVFIPRFGAIGDLAIILLISFVIKFLVVIYLPSIHQADEIYQTLEPAFRISFGYGVSTWEFEDGIRSLLLPNLLSKIFDMVAFVSDKPEVSINTVRVVLACTSLICVVAIYYYGLSINRLHAIIASIVLGTWFEIVHFSVRPTPESLAGTFLLSSICFGLLSQKTGVRRNLLLAGFFASLAVMLRFHIGVGVLILAIWVCRSDLYKWLTFIIGGLPPLIAFGVSDWIAWGAPFVSFVKYFQANLIEGKAAHWGVKPFWWYFYTILKTWGGCVPILAFLALYKARITTVWLVIGCSIILAHSLIGHKEYRFIYPAQVCLIAAAALGSAQLTELLVARFRQQRMKLVALVVTLWCSTSAALALSPGYISFWMQSRELIQAFYFLHSREDLCGLLLFEEPWWETGGYAHLQRNVPLYVLSAKRLEIKDTALLANYAVAPGDQIGALQPTYQTVQCFGAGRPSSVCVLSRPGLCSKSNSILPLTLRRRLGE